MTQINQKLIVISREDLSPGYQAVQSAHAAINFQYQYPKIAKNWNSKSNYLIFLSCKSQDELIQYKNKFDLAGLLYTLFYEPDINNELTAIAIEPSEKTKKICSNLPLLLKKYNNR